MPDSPPDGRPSVGMISLGCAKNLSDAEVMLGTLRRSGYPITADPEGADILIVNTCGFIESAREESVAAIFEARRQLGRRRGRSHRKLIVAGCLAQRYPAELPASMPEADAFIGLDQVGEIDRIVGDVWEGAGGRSYVTPKPRYIPDWDTPRLRLTPRHFAYVKIAEGCNHPCSFCAIPRMRGRHRSRPIDSILAEARELVASGTRELLLISQDTTFYGMDLWKEKAGPRQGADPARGPGLIQLVRGLDAIGGDFWVRLLYTHPAHWSDALIEAIAASRKVARYIDIPIQHIHGDMLRAMRRETTEAHIAGLIRRIRQGIPGVALRTTFIVGFPGETDSHFARLMEFIEETRFERLGVFTYSKEEGTRAASLPDAVPARTRHRRFEKAMELQQRLAREIQASRVGSRLKVLVDSPTSARSEADAPEIDGAVLLESPLPVGDFAHVDIVGSSDYDLIARPADPDRHRE